MRTCMHIYTLKLKILRMEAILGDVKYLVVSKYSMIGTAAYIQYVQCQYYCSPVA